jgi:hypothetical protein
MVSFQILGAALLVDIETQSQQLLIVEKNTALSSLKMPGRCQMGIFEGRNTVFTLLVVINQAHASLAEDAHPSFFQVGIFGAQVGRWATSLASEMGRYYISIQSPKPQLRSHWQTPSRPLFENFDSFTLHPHYISENAHGRQAIPWPMQNSASSYATSGL